MLRNESIFHSVKHKLINTKFLQAGMIQRFRLRIHKKITLFLLSAVMHHLSEEIPKYFSLILHKKEEEGLDSLASSLSSFFLPLRILFCSSFFFLFLTIPIVLISVSPEPLRPPLHLLISLSLSLFLNLSFFLLWLPPFFISGEEAMKYLRLCCCWGLYLDKTEPPPFFLCLSLVCMCAPVCVCWHAHHAAVTAAHPQILC